jgi:hypothetical protein
MHSEKQCDRKHLASQHVPQSNEPLCIVLAAAMSDAGYNIFL